MTMSIEEQKERIKQKREALRRELLILENKGRGLDRKADNHLKLALGASILANIESGKISTQSAGVILRMAEQAIQKDGLAREKFEELKKKYPLKIENPK